MTEKPRRPPKTADRTVRKRSAEPRLTDNLGALDLFVGAADAKSFARIAKLHGITSSAVGKAVARLEERLDVRLFHRSTRSISLTPEGEFFLAHCRRIFREVDAAEDEIQALRGAPRGRLRVSFPLASRASVEVLGAFMREYPAVELDVDFSDRLVDVIGEGFDLVVRGGGPTDSQLVGRVLGDARFRLAAAPDYLARRGTPRRVEDLAAHACLRYRYHGSGRLDSWDFGRPVEVPRTMTANTADALLDMAARGHGLVYLPDYMMAPQLARRDLVAVLDELPTRTTTIRVLWPASRQASPKRRAFVEFLSRHLLVPRRGAGRQRKQLEL